LLRIINHDSFQTLILYVIKSLLLKLSAILQYKGRHTHTSLLQDRKTGETINISAPIWIFTDMFMPVSVDL